MRAEIRDGDSPEAWSELSASGSVAVSVVAVSADDSLEFLMMNLSGLEREVMGLKDMRVGFVVVERKLLRRMWTVVVDGTAAAAMLVLVAAPVTVSVVGIEEAFVS